MSHHYIKTFRKGKINKKKSRKLISFRLNNLGYFMINYNKLKLLPGLLEFRSTKCAFNNWKSSSAILKM